MTKLTFPFTEAQVRALKVGDEVSISGVVFTGRDAVHSHLMKHEPPVDLNGSVLYHCGPVVVKEGDGYRVTAAGPTTSIREEPYQADVIRRYGVRAVIGKGGMGKKTSDALKEYGAVYLNGIGGAAQYYARTMEEVLGRTGKVFVDAKGNGSNFYLPLDKLIQSTAQSAGQNAPQVRPEAPDESAPSPVQRSRAA